MTRLSSLALFLPVVFFASSLISLLFTSPSPSSQHRTVLPKPAFLERRNNVHNGNDSQMFTASDLAQRGNPVDANHWASVNGQACKVTDCVPRDWQIPDGWTVAPGGIFRDNCLVGDDERKAVICPLGAAPQQCQWRGSGSCHGQCHPGETTLAHSPWGDRICMAPGQQAFCCQSNTWAPYAAKCGWAQPGEECAPDSRYAVSTRTAPGSSQKQHWCCPYPFENCHWIGKGTCDDNECSSTDVMAGLDPSGDTGDECHMYERRKPLCCNPPSDLNPFLPVPAEDLFPTMPPGNDEPAFDLQVLSTTPKPKPEMGTDMEAFLFVVIEGPPGAVSNVNKRDGSHLEFITGPIHHGQASQTAHFVCMVGGVESNCHDMHLDGLPGTVLRMPDHLGFAQWAVAHSVRASNYTIPRDLAKRAPTTAQVLELEYSYDFSRVRRDSGPLYVRVDYSDQIQYYTQIVNATHHKKRDLLPRFWSKNFDEWGKKIQSVRNVIAPPGQTPTIRKDFSDILLYGEDGTKHHCSAGDGFLKASLSGSVHSDFHFGFTLVGTLVPFALEEAYGYFDSNMSMSGELQFDGKGFVSMRGSPGAQSIFPVLENYQASHPGIISFAPQLDAQVDLLGYGQIDGQFSAKFESGSSKMMQMQAPGDLDPSGYHGDALNLVPGNSVSGYVKVNQTDFVNIFAMHLNLEARMNVSVASYGTSDEQAGALFVERTPYVLQVVGNGGSGKPAIIAAPQQAIVETISRKPVRPEWDDDTAHPVGVLPGRTTIFHGGEAPPGPRKAPDLQGNPLFGQSDLMECSDPEVVLVCTFKFEQYASDTKTPQDPSATPKRTLFGKLIESYNRLLGRQAPAGPSSGAKGSYTIQNPDPNVKYKGRPNLRFVTPTYPAGNNGAALDKVTGRDERIAEEDPDDCGNTAITLEGEEGENYEKMNSEHPLDRVIATSRFFDFALTGILDVKQGSPYASGLTVMPFDHLSDYLKQPYAQWCPQSVRLMISDLRASLESAVGNALGSTTNPEVMVNLEEDLNSLKGRIYGKSDPVMAATKVTHYKTPSSQEEFEEALSLIRAPFAMFNQMNSDLMRSKREQVVNGIVAALKDFDICYSEAHPGGASLENLWHDFYERRNRLVATRIFGQVDDTLQKWEVAWSLIAANPADPLHEVAEAALQKWKELAGSMTQIGLKQNRR